MEQEIRELINRILSFEENGKVREAGEMLDRLIEARQGDHELLVERGLFRFRHQMDFDALIDLSNAYNLSKDPQIRDTVLEAYYEPNRGKLEEKYRKNSELIKDYEFVYLKQDAVPDEVCPVWYDDRYCVWYSKREDSFFLTVRKNLDTDGTVLSGKYALMHQWMWMDDIVRIEACTTQEEYVLNEYNALYLSWETGGFTAFLQLADGLEELLKGNRTLYYGDLDSLRSYFLGQMAIPPSIYLGCGSTDIHSLVSEIVHERNQKERWYISENDDYYLKHGDEVVQHINEKKPKILFSTSIYTSALQYFVRDVSVAAEKAGCQVFILKEKNWFEKSTTEAVSEAIYEFHPDILFLMDHFRYEHKDVLPDGLVVVTWIQDPLPNIMDGSSASKLGARDIVLNHFVSWKRLLRLYEGVEMMDAPVPSNNTIYRHYDLTTEESDCLGSDIAVVAHFTLPSELYYKFFSWVDKDIYDLISKIYDDYYQMVYQTGKPLWGEEAFSRLIKDKWLDYTGSEIPEDLLAGLTEFLESQYSQFAFKEALVNWVIDAGFENLKIWGKGWDHIDRFKPFSMGAATNGETLSKIYQASRVVLGTNAAFTSAVRAGEAMLSGTFYMANYIPEEYDWVDIRKVYEEDRDIIMFHDRDDLVSKLKFYLGHEEERRIMAEKGQKLAENHLDYDSFMKRFLEESSEILSRQLEQEKSENKNG